MNNLNVDIVSACNHMYGVKEGEEIPWPGTFRTNLNQYANACYGSVARLNNFQSNSQVLDSNHGKLCEKAMNTQLKLNGRNPCQNWIPAPMINLPPQISFYSEIKKGISVDQAYNNAINSCKTQECKDNATLDRLAYIIAHPPQPPPPPPPSPPPPAPLKPDLNLEKKHKGKKKCKNCNINKSLYLFIIFSFFLITLFIVFFRQM